MYYNKILNKTLDETQIILCVCLFNLRLNLRILDIGLFTKHKGNIYFENAVNVYSK